MENMKDSKRSFLLNIALVAGGFIAGAAIWLPSHFSVVKDNVSEVEKELANAKGSAEIAVTRMGGLNLTMKDKELIGQIAAQYLIAHPENLVEAGKRLEANRDGDKMSNVVNTKDVLLESTYTPNYGPANADVAVIEFFDYMCHFCQQSSPVLEKAIAANKNVRTYFKDFTIFADRTPISGMGAKIGLYIFKKYGQDKYYEYHNKLMAATGAAMKARRDYTPTELASLLTKLGYEDILDERGNFMLSPEIRDQLQSVVDANMMLADKLNYNGTPVFIVMNIKNPTNDTTTVMPGAPDYFRIQKAIDVAKGQN